MPISDSDSTSLSNRSEVFNTTHWSVVVNAGHELTEQAALALERLCQTYWSPLYAYVRRCGHDEDSARDLTQSFFAQLIEKRRLTHADRERGRFRTFMLGAMQNFLHNEHDRLQALKRGGGREVISLDQQESEEYVLRGVSDRLTPERLFEKRWASRLIEVVMERLRTEFIAEGKADLFDRLEPHLWGDATSVPYLQVANDMNMSLSALKSTTHRLRQRAREILREEIANTVAAVADIDAEIRHLMDTFSD